MGSIYALKPAFVRSLRPFEDRLVAKRVTPDALSLAGVVCSAVAGACIGLASITDTSWLFLIAASFCVVRLAFNALDGSVARRTGTESSGGAVTNEICDRVADGALLLGCLAVTPPLLAFATLSCVLFVSSLGVLGQTVGLERLTTGPMGKADRSVSLAIGCVAAAFVGDQALVWALWVVALGCVPTAAVRTRRLIEASK